MKLQFCFILCSLFLFGSLNAQNREGSTFKDRTLKNGFSAQFEFGIPGSNYGLTNRYVDGFGNDLGEVDFRNGIFLGLQIGNRWYLQRKETSGIGIMVNWFDSSIGINVSSNRVNSPTIVKATIDFSLLEFGPVWTYKISETSAIDAYYNLRPTLFTSVTADADTEGGLGSVAAGFTHAIGFAFRYKVLYFGPEMVFGKFKDREVRDGEDANIVYFKDDLIANNFRILLGLKF